MADLKEPSFCCMYLLLLCLLQITASFAERKPYVVYMGGLSHGPNFSSMVEERIANSHSTLLGSYLGSEEKAKEAIFYHYTKHINGFAAKLEEEEAMEIAKHPDVVTVFQSRVKKLHTTNSWRFLGLERNGRVPKASLWSRAKFGEDIIIANIDTGVWPESQSFNDEGLGPIPSRWKGICQNKTVPCNRKLIGSRYFYKGIEAGGAILNSSQLSPRDYEGHGTHTLSTGGGRFVANVSIYGFADGYAKGGSPAARVAAYKACWPEAGCDDADILAALDQAIEDGVDVLSVSLGGVPWVFSDDGLAIGAFHAVSKGVVVVCSAGNEGPEPGTVSNTAPWLLAVGASTHDRTFPSIVKLGNQKEYTGQSLSSSMPQKFYPLILAEQALSANATVAQAQLCLNETLDPKKAKEKVVVCLRGVNPRLEKGIEVRRAGGVAMILANDDIFGDEVIPDRHSIPATHVTFDDGLAVYNYIKSTKSPRAYLTTPITELGTKPAPSMADFSSRGPNSIIAEILKPDITAPGVDIIAAFSEASSPSESVNASNRFSYVLLSGTSMSCPHVAGIAGLLKSLHPDWSPSAIQSAIMTTARTRDNHMETIIDKNNKKEANPFSYGAGHVRPNKAMDPGLVYDLTIDDYIGFLCNSGMNSTQILAITGKKHTCPSKKSSLLSFNYPSITVPGLNRSVTINRTLKNVGTPGTYTVRVLAPARVSITVKPSSLTFSKMGEEKSYKMEMKPGVGANKLANKYVFGRIIWSDGVHHVRSPIVVKHGKKKA